MNIENQCELCGCEMVDADDVDCGCWCVKCGEEALSYWEYRKYGNDEALCEMCYDGYLNGIGEGLYEDYLNGIEDDKQWNLKSVR